MEEDDFLDRVDRYLMPETATGTAGVVGMSMVPILGDTIDAADVAYGVRNRDPARAGFGLLGLALGPLGGGAALRELFKRSKRGRKALEAPRQPLLLGSGPTSLELEREPGEMLLGLPGLWRSNALETIERAPRHSMTPSQWEAYLKKKPGGIKKIASHLQRLDAQNPNQKISRDELLGVTESQLAPERSVNRQVRSLNRAADIVHDTDTTRGPLGENVVRDIARQFELAANPPPELMEVFGIDLELLDREDDLVDPYAIIEYISQWITDPWDGLRTYPERLSAQGIEVSNQAVKEFNEIVNDIEFSKTKGLKGTIDRLGQFERGVLHPYEQAVPEIATVNDPLFDLLASTMQEPLILEDGAQLTIPEIAAKGITSDQLLRRLSRGHAAKAIAIENLFESGSPIQSLEDFIAKVNQKLVAVTRGSDTESLSPLKTIGRLMPQFNVSQYRFPDSYYDDVDPSVRTVDPYDRSPYEEIVYYLDPEEIGSKKVSGMAGHFSNVDNQVMHVRASKRPFFIADAQEGPRSGRGLGNVYFVEELQSDVHQRATDTKRKTKKRFGTETSGYSKARSQLDDRDFEGASGKQGIHAKLIDSSEDLRNAERASFEDKVKAVQTGLLRTEGYTKEFVDEFINRTDERKDISRKLHGLSVPEEVKGLFAQLSSLQGVRLEGRDDLRANTLNALNSYAKKVKKRISESLVMTTEAKQDIIDAIDYFDTKMLESGRLANEMLIEAVNPSEDVPFKKGSEWARFMIQDLLRKAAAEGAEGFTMITPDQLRLSMDIRSDFNNPKGHLHRRWKGNLNWYGEVLPNILKKEAKRLGLEIQSGLPIDKGRMVPFDSEIGTTSLGSAELDLMTPRQRELSQIENVVIMLNDEARKKILSDIPSFKFGGLVN